MDKFSIPNLVTRVCRFSATSSFGGDVGTITTAVIGANGTDEGYHYASFLMGTGGTGGTAIMTSGAIYSSPFIS